MSRHDLLKARLSRSSDRQIGVAALAMLGAIALIDIVLVAGAFWIARIIMTRTSGATQALGILASAALLCSALVGVWRLTRGYRNLRRLLDDTQKERRQP